MVVPSDLSWAEAFSGKTPSGRDRREGERVVGYWETRLIELGGGFTIDALGLDDTSSPRWSNRFLISVDPIPERSSLVLYGPKFAALLQLPKQARPDLPMFRQLPRRYTDVFLSGCAQAQKGWGPARREGEVTRDDGKIEQYRVVFIPIGIKQNSLTCFAFGAFNRRIVAHAAA